MSTQRKLDDAQTEAADLEATMPDNAVTRALADWFENYGYCDDSCDWSVCWPQMRRHIEDRIFPRDSEAQK